MRPCPYSALLNPVGSKLTGVPEPSEWIHPGGCHKQSPGQGQTNMSEENKKVAVSDPFRQVVLAELTRRAESDPLFAISFRKENKNIGDCISYILETVQKSGIQGFTDDEVFGMACHYYDEDEITIDRQLKCKVIVNHTIQLTLEEIQKSKQEAKDKVINDEINRLHKKPEVKKQVEANPTLFEF